MAKNTQTTKSSQTGDSGFFILLFDALTDRSVPSESRAMGRLPERVARLEVIGEAAEHRLRFYRRDVIRFRDRLGPGR
ncbi:MAG: hypothetical protein ACRDVD_09010 [Acidimicrobiia bacterium]